MLEIIFQINCFHKKKGQKPTSIKEVFLSNIYYKGINNKQNLLVARYFFYIEKAYNSIDNFSKGYFAYLPNSILLHSLYNSPIL